MAHTKKVGIVGRLGVRYGVKIRQKVAAVEIVQRAAHQCPDCFKPAVRRESAGIWVCGKCGLKFAGKAYKPA